jgi:hypothetical protein
MASLFNEPGNYVAQQTRSFVSRAAAVRESGLGNILMYGLLAAIVVFIILMLWNKRLNFDWIKPKRLLLQNEGTVYWNKGDRFTNLYVSETDAIQNFQDQAYSISFDCILFDTRNRNATQGPYRQLVHRGSDELMPPRKSLMDMELPPMPADGLPKHMNPGVFLDPNLNDIIVFVDTSMHGEFYRESLRIADLPLQIPFRLEIVINGRVLDVYINCQLEATKMLQGYPRTVKNAWYGLAGNKPAQAQIQNLWLWNRTLTVDEIKQVCGPELKFKQLRSKCVDDEPDPVRPIAKKQQPINTKKMGISYGNSLCNNAK